MWVIGITWFSPCERSDKFHCTRWSLVQDLGLSVRQNLRKLTEEMHPSRYTPYKAIDIVTPFFNHVTGSLASTNQHHSFAFMLRDKWLELRAVVNFASEIFKESLYKLSRICWWTGSRSRTQFAIGCLSSLLTSPRGSVECEATTETCRSRITSRWRCRRDWESIQSPLALENPTFLSRMTTKSFSLSAWLWQC